MPASNRVWWAEKFSQNVARDAKKTQQLRDAGWRVMILWECAVRDKGPTRDQAIKQLSDWIRSDIVMGTIPPDKIE